MFPAAGSDQWLAISVTSDETFAVLARILDFAVGTWGDEACRKADELNLEQQIAQRTAGFDKHELSSLLLANGIAAAPVLDASELVDEPSLRERGSMVEVDHPEAGKLWQLALPAILSTTPGGVTRPAPLQSEHSLEVLSALAGLSESEYRDLVDRGLTGTGPTGKASIANQA
jgi:crotonobetainyl-CoA:carnitine CoA-transferase CaiB-like acyl-CoA transferase